MAHSPSRKSAKANIMGGVDNAAAAAADDAAPHDNLMMNREDDELPCNSFYRIACTQKHLKYIETVWLPGINDEIRNFKGFRHRLVIPPTVVEQDDDSDAPLEYVVILYFQGIQNLRSWAVSGERQYWVDQAARRGIVVGSLADRDVPVDDDDSTNNGGAAAAAAVWTKSKPTQIELHHDAMKSAPKVSPPPRYKLFLVIWMCVFSMNIVNNFANGKVPLMALGVPYSGALFVELCHTMPVIIYALAPLIMSLAVVARWIKVRCASSERFVVV